MKLKFKPDPPETGKNFYTKILVLGNPGVGKTTLIRALSSDSSDMAKNTKSSKHFTRGDGELNAARVDYTKWSVGITSDEFNGTLELGFLDFSGEDICRTAHRFFLSQRCVYVVCLDLTRCDELSRIAFWLSSVRSFNRDATILLVGTHADKLGSTQIVDALQIYADTFSFLRGVYATSKSHNLSLQRFRMQLLTFCSTLPHIGKPTPKDASLIVSKINALQQSVGVQSTLPPVLSLHDFILLIKSDARISAAGHSMDDATAKRFAVLLSDLDIVVFPPRVDVVVLSKQWIVDLVHVILAHGRSHVKDGKLALRDLPGLLCSSSEDMMQTFDEVVPLLRAFDILYQVRMPRMKTFGGRARGGVTDLDVSFYVPCLFDNKPTPTIHVLWQHQNLDENAKNVQAWGRVYTFHFLPPSFFERLVVRILALSEKTTRSRTCYRDAVRLEQDNQLVLLRFDPTNYVLRLSARGDSPALFLFIMDLVEQFLCTSFRQLLKEVFVVCGHCLEHKSFRIFPTLFQFEKVIDSVLDPVNKTCQCDRMARESLKATDLAPEFDLNRIGVDIVPFDELDLIGEIGKGAFGTVHKARWRGMVTAVKVMDIDMESNEEHLACSFSEFRREISILKDVKHSCAVNLLACCPSPFAVVMEFVPHGDLCDYLATLTQPLPMREILRIALDAVQCLAHLHSKEPPIVHRDMKSPNILLADPSGDSPVMAKVCDFGLSTQFSFVFDDTKVVDNPRWSAPEVLVSGEYSPASDVYGWAMTMAELLTANLPFADSPITFMTQLEEAIVDGLRPILPKATPLALRNLLERCWSGVPKTRPLAHKIASEIFKMVDDADEGTLVGLDEWNEWRLTEEARIPGRDTPSSESLDELPTLTPTPTIIDTPALPVVDWEADRQVVDDAGKRKRRKRKHKRKKSQGGRRSRPVTMNLMDIPLNLEENGELLSKELTETTTQQDAPRVVCPKRDQPRCVKQVEKPGSADSTLKAPPTKEGIFRQLLSTDEKCSDFRIYLRGLNSSAELDFWMDVDELEDISDDKNGDLNKSCRAIVHDFLALRAEHPIEVRESLLDKARQLAKSMDQSHELKNTLLQIQKDIFLSLFAAFKCYLDAPDRARSDSLAPPPSSPLVRTRRCSVRPPTNVQNQSDVEKRALRITRKQPHVPSKMRPTLKLPSPRAPDPPASSSDTLMLPSSSSSPALRQEEKVASFNMEFPSSPGTRKRSASESCGSDHLGPNDTAEAEDQLQRQRSPRLMNESMRSLETTASVSSIRRKKAKSTQSRGALSKSGSHVGMSAIRPSSSSSSGSTIARPSKTSKRSTADQYGALRRAKSSNILKKSAIAKPEGTS